MIRALACAALAALLLGAAASARLPRQGVLVPGHSLAGVRLGERAPAVRAALGRGYGVCQGCSRATWYFTYRRFDQHGIAVELTRGRVSAVYTLWQPAGWRAARGPRLGAVDAQVTKLVRGTIPVTCVGYEALITDVAHTQTAYYIVNGTLWGFGLLKRRDSPCR